MTLILNPADHVGYGKAGGHGAQAYKVLKQVGYPQINNLQGGILAWAEDIDQMMPKY